MTNEETIEVLDDMKIKIDIPKAAITQHKRNEALDKAVKALNALNEIQAEINTPNRGTCDYFIVDRIEEIINKYKLECER